MNPEIRHLIVPLLVHEMLPLGDGPAVGPHPRPDGPHRPALVDDEACVAVHERPGAPRAIPLQELELLNGDEVFPRGSGLTDVEPVRVPILSEVALVERGREPGVLRIHHLGFAALGAGVVVLAVVFVGVLVGVCGAAVRVQQVEVVGDQGAVVDGTGPGAEEQVEVAQGLAAGVQWVSDLHFEFRGLLSVLIEPLKNKVIFVLVKVKHRDGHRVPPT